MSIRSFAILLIATLGFTLLSKAQSPWVKPAGEGFFKLSQTILVSDQFYSPEGSIQDIKTAGVYITSVYGEFGLTNDLTAFAYIPFFFRNTINEQSFSISPNNEPGDESNSFGDFNVGLAYGIIKEGPLALNVSLTLGIPTGETAGGNSQILQSGDGEFNQLLRLNLGYSFYPAPFYASSYVGINNRTRDFSEEFHFGLEAGYTPNDSWVVAMRFGLVESANNGDATASQTGIFSNNTEFAAIGPEVTYLLKNGFGLSVGLLGALSGQNILARPTYSVGLVYDLKQ